MGFRKILAALCIVAIAATGIGAAVFLVNHMNTVNSTPSAPRSSLVPPEPKIPTPDEFKVGVQVTAQQCDPNGTTCIYTYSIEPNYTGFHPLPDRDFAVFYEIVGGNAPQPGNFTVSNGQARVYKDVTVEGPPGAQLQANVTAINPIAGPKPPPPVDTLAPMPIRTPDRQPASP